VKNGGDYSHINPLSGHYTARFNIMENEIQMYFNTLLGNDSGEAAILGRAVYWRKK
jgi:hypothetical protein